MIINILIESEYKKTVWCKETYSGIESKAAALRYKLCEITETELSDKLRQLIVIGTSPIWVTKILKLCTEHKITPIVVSCQPMDTDIKSNCVLIDHTQATIDCINYMHQCGRDRLALYGVNPNSYADRIKTRFFNDADIYSINNSYHLESCFEYFYSNIDKYNGVICTNYVSAVQLMMSLKRHNITVPKKLYVITYGDSMLGKLISPSLTTITLNHRKLGEQSVSLYRYIQKNEDSITVTVSVPCKIVPCESTANAEFQPKEFLYNDTLSETDIFSSDKDIISIQNLEKLLLKAEEIDFSILDALIIKNSISSIAEALYMSDGAVKYRIKRLIQASGFSDLATMLNIYKKYLK